MTQDPQDAQYLAALSVLQRGTQGEVTFLQRGPWPTGREGEWALFCHQFLMTYCRTRSITIHLQILPNFDWHTAFCAELGIRVERQSLQDGMIGLYLYPEEETGRASLLRALLSDVNWRTASRWRLFLGTINPDELVTHWESQRSSPFTNISPVGLGSLRWMGPGGEIALVEALIRNLAKEHGIQVVGTKKASDLLKYSLTRFELAWPSSFVLRYSEGRRTMHFQFEPRESSRAWTIQDVAKWDPPYDRESVPEKKQIEILARVAMFLYAREREVIWVEGFGFIDGEPF